MDLKVSFGGIDATVTVKDAAEAISFLKSLSAAQSSNDSSPSTPVQQSETSDTQLSPDDGPQVPAEQLRDAIQSLSGSAAAQVLAAIDSYEKGCQDSVLRAKLKEKYQWESDKLGPIMSNISKACKRADIPATAILTRASKRLGKGKVAYFFRVTPEASKVIRSIPKFDQAADASEFFG